MTAAALIREVFAVGGQIRADGSDLVLTAPRPLPDDLLAQIREHKPAILDALVRPDPLPPASEARRRKVLAMARDGRQFAVYVEDPNSNPVIAALTTPDGTCEVLIPKVRYDPFAVLAMVETWET